MSRFPTSQFCSQPDDAFICSVCQDVLDEPTVTRCGHVFCRYCIFAVAENDCRCPMCRESFNKINDLMPVMHAFKSLLNKMTMRCMHADCEETVILENYLSHLDTCDFAQVCCPHENCENKCYRKDMAGHKAECEFRPISCPKGCGIEIKFKDSSHHYYEECVNGHRICTRCKAEYEYKEQGNHDCIKYLIECIQGLQQQNQMFAEKVQVLEKKFENLGGKAQDLEEINCKDVSGQDLQDNEGKDPGVDEKDFEKTKDADVEGEDGIVIVPKEIEG